MTRDEMIEAVQFAREWAEAQVAEAKDHGALVSVFELDKVLAALRAAPPAPAPELVAAFAERCGEIRHGSPNAFYDHVDKFCKAWTPAASVEPPARPETGTRELLAELVTLVRGECPSLLNEDSGGDGRLSGAIDRALVARPETAAPTPAPTREQLAELSSLASWYSGAAEVAHERSALKAQRTKQADALRAALAALSSPVGETVPDHEAATYEAIGRYAVQSARWIRHAHEHYAAVPVALGANLDSRGTRFDALRRAAASPVGETPAPVRDEDGFCTRDECWDHDKCFDHCKSPGGHPEGK